jgi:hypothetical protein
MRSLLFTPLSTPLHLPLLLLAILPPTFSAPTPIHILIPDPKDVYNPPPPGHIFPPSDTLRGGWPDHFGFGFRFGEEEGEEGVKRDVAAGEGVGVMDGVEGVEGVEEVGMRVPGGGGTAVCINLYMATCFFFLFFFFFFLLLLFFFGWLVV